MVETVCFPTDTGVGVAAAALAAASTPSTHISFVAIDNNVHDLDTPFRLARHPFWAHKNAYCDVETLCCCYAVGYVQRAS